ncbi:glycosyltransferase [Georgenia sp. SYP-B2076]|uniref:glycosyltransferase n=1 Tax=Georgenia sp. SYP-B2076 TaxID=2495881 RepID=UPI000F8ED850|nr:glycosyltransferase [Georgenia sp. SYP-B2076]
MTVEVESLLEEIQTEPDGLGLLEELRAQFDGREMALSLTADGVAAAEAVGAPWLAAALRSLTLAYPGSPVELVLRTSGTEPMAEGWEAVPANAGSFFLGQGGVGRLSVAGTDTGAAPVRRVLQMPRPELLTSEGDYAFIQPTDPVRRAAGKLYSTLYRKTPLALDTWRQGRNSTPPGGRSPMVPKAQTMTSAGRTALLLAPESRRPAVWVAMHWLESGGAEAWGFRSAEIARDAGYEVVITADRSSPQRSLARALAITPHVYLGANALFNEDWEPFLLGILQRHDIAQVHIHHSAKVYRFLPELRHRTRGVTVMDSTHLVEHRTGGFVRNSLEYSHLIDAHHVISPELRDLYLLDARVDPDKVAYRPLTDLASPATASVGEPLENDEVAAAAVTGARSDRRGDGPLRVGFLGRLAPQKRPFLYIELARRLHKAHPDQFSFLMQGSGALESIVAEQIARSGLGGVLTRREWGPAAEFFDDVDVLVVSSDNEGLTLTTIEAEEHGVLVLSADVGSQRTVIAPGLLVPRRPRGFLITAQRALERVATDPRAFALARSQQRRLLRGLRSVEPAGQYLTTYYARKKEQA